MQTLNDMTCIISIFLLHNPVGINLGTKSLFPSYHDMFSADLDIIFNILMHILCLAYECIHYNRHANAKRPDIVKGLFVTAAKEVVKSLEDRIVEITANVKRLQNDLAVHEIRLDKLTAENKKLYSKLFDVTSELDTVE